VRDTILLSHANPEDNEFTLWLALQLASEGYRVWCDLTKLLGGEVFWDDIQEVIRDRAAKVIYVLSRASNSKDGPLRELHLAQTLARGESLPDFVIPAHIDDLPNRDVTIELTRVNSVAFQGSWAAGLAVLLRKLETDGVPKSESFNRSAVNDWWRSQFGEAHGIRKEPEVVVSNWFKVESLPTIIYEHRISRETPGLVDFDTTNPPYPAVWLNDLSFLSFAPSIDFADYLAPKFYIAQSREILTSDFLERRDLLKDGPKYLAQILRVAWDAAVRKKLPAYETADGRFCYYFKKDAVKNDEVPFVGANGKKGYRAVVGYKTVAAGRIRYWHYAFSGKPIIRPETLFLVKGHVLFSDDGLNIWSNKDLLAKARRNQCRNWWNDEWRDRMYAAMAHLADPNDAVDIPVGANTSFSLSRRPICFESPVSYIEPHEVVKDDELRDYDFEDEDVFEEAAEVSDGIVGQQVPE
jgi:hypothetical protein